MSSSDPADYSCARNEILLMEAGGAKILKQVPERTGAGCLPAVNGRKNFRACHCGKTATGGMKMHPGATEAHGSPDSLYSNFNRCCAFVNSLASALAADQERAFSVIASHARAQDTASDKVFA